MRASLGRLRARVLVLGPVVRLRSVLDAYGAAGGGLLAAGLAFGAVFALVPITLLIVGVSGFVVADVEIRRTLLEQLARLVPPLEQFIALALDQVAAGAAGLSLVALLGFTWTASQFYGQLDGAFALVFRNTPRRGLVARTARGLVTLAAAIGVFVLLIVVSVVSTRSLPFLATLEPLVRVASPLIGVGIVVGLIGVVYRFVPNRHVSWGAVRLPAFVVGLAEVGLTTLFVVIAPFLASARVFGPFVTLFASFAWLSWSFQLLLLGAAWVRERLVESGGDDRAD